MLREEQKPSMLWSMNLPAAPAKVALVAFSNKETGVSG